MIECRSAHCECDELERAHCSAKLMDRAMNHKVILVVDYGRIEHRLMAALCEEAACRTVEAPEAPMPRTCAQHECHEHGGVEQRGPVRGVLPVLSQGWRLNEDARCHKAYSRPAPVHAVARRCCELAGCARGKCLACLATRQRHRSGGDVSGPSDLVQPEAKTPTLRDRARLDWAFLRWAVAQVDGVWVSGTGVPQASDR
jgi:hypothetical protein